MNINEKLEKPLDLVGRLAAAAMVHSLSGNRSPANEKILREIAIETSALQKETVKR